MGLATVTQNSASLQIFLSSNAQLEGLCEHSGYISKLKILTMTWAGKMVDKDKHKERNTSL